jgi:hypothetical protein
VVDFGIDEVLFVNLSLFGTTEGFFGTHPLQAGLSLSNSTTDDPVLRNYL